MYQNPVCTPISASCEAVNSMEESLQMQVAEILDMTRHCRGISSSIQNGLFGPQLQNANVKESNINCMADALKEIKTILNEALITLENVSRKL